MPQLTEISEPAPLSFRSNFTQDLNDCSQFYQQNIINGGNDNILLPNSPKLMMTSSNGNISVTDPLWGESTSDWWIPLTKISDMKLWYFLWSAPEQTVEQTIKTLVIWDGIVLIVTSLLCNVICL